MTKMADGYGFWWKGGYWASLTTGGEPAAGRHDILFGPVPADTHGHVWVKISPGGDQLLGSQLKDRGQHVHPPTEGSFSTQPVLRGRAEWSDAERGITTYIAQLTPPSAYSAAPVTSRRTVSSRDPQRVELAVPTDAIWFDFELALTQNRSPDPSSNSTLLAFGGSSPLAVRLSVTGWGK
jgi:hypothetical protein